MNAPPVVTEAPQSSISQMMPTVSSITSSMGDLRQDYEGARETRFTQRPKGMPTWGVSPDYHLRAEGDFWYMLEYSRHLENNDPVLPQGVSRFVANIIQGGFTLKPETGVDWLDRLQTERFQQFADSNNRQNVDHSMEHSWHDIERIAVRRMIFDGDCGIVPMHDGRLECVEAHNIRSPIFGYGRKLRRNNNVFLGVEKNSVPQVTRYWIHPDENVAQTSRNKPRGVNAWDFDEITQRNEANFFHCYVGNRFKQSRGMIALANVLQTAGMHGDVHFATLVKQQMASFIGLVHEIPFTQHQEYQQPTARFEICPNTGRMIAKGPKLEPGAEFYPRWAGEKIQPFQSNIPSTEFFEHSRLLLTYMSLSLGMPLILFLLDATETNFSAWRGALDQAKIQFMLFQNNVASRLHSPVWRWKMRRFLRQDAGLRRAYEVMGEDALNFTWQCPGWPYIEPLKDAQADAIEIGANLISPRRVAARRQLNYDEIMRETVEDREKLIVKALEAADRINQSSYIQANPDERVTWREISHPVMPDGLQMQILDRNAESSNERSGKTGTQEQQQMWYPPANMVTQQGVSA